MKMLIILLSALSLLVACQDSDDSDSVRAADQSQVEMTDNEESNETQEQSSQSPAEQEALQTALILKDSDKIAVNGADVVAYFSLAEDADAVIGDSEFSYDWSDVTWLFSSAENRDAFMENPLMYAPQFGGYCAWAASQNYKAQTDPDAWSVVDDKLYLNASKSVRSLWLKNTAELIADGNQNWPGIVARETSE